MGLKKYLLPILKNENFAKPTPVQMQVIPLFLAKKDIIACAPTGTGKTLAFLLPLMSLINVFF